jgi:uncharacterized membrane protein
MSSPPIWTLSIIYWLHMLATVIWIGALAALSIVLLPAARSFLEPGAYSRLLEGIQRRLDPLSWLCLTVLTGTGLFQMSANPNYEGMLAINNRWAAAILIKHLVFLGLTASSAVLTWGILPRLRRAALRTAHNLLTTDELERLQRQERRLLQLNLLLGVVILALTALARVS